MMGVFGNTIASTPSTERGKMSIQPKGAEKGSSKIWPEGALEDWENGASYGWIADKYGRGYSTVAKMIRAAQLLGAKRLVDIGNRKRQGGRQPLHERKPLSAMHLHVGLKISRFRQVENDYSCSEFAALIKTNRLTARLMELGLYDFKLLELQVIADLMRLTLAELMGLEAVAVRPEHVQENDDYSRTR
ncbi:MAG: hypothetical protein ACTHJV_14085 [Rhizobiaceae bacterium]